MKTFYYLLGNTIIASVTNFTVWFAIIFFVFLETKSVFATSIISGLYLVSVAASGFWLGGFVDRYKKKTMMLISSIISLVTYVLAFGLYLTAPADAFTRVNSLVLWIFVPLILFGVIVGNIRNIALPTVITFLVPEDKRDKANGLASTTAGISFLITSVISGFLVGHSGMYLVLLLAIIATGIAILHLWTVPLREKKITHAEELENDTQKLDIKGTVKVVAAIPGLLALILFTTINNFLGGVFMSLMDAYGLSLVSVQVWGLLWGVLSTGFIVGGLVIARIGLGKNPLRTLFLANVVIWIVSCFFTLRSSIILLMIGMYIYLVVVPFIEASEHTIIQKLVPPQRQGRVFGFAQSVEQAASPLTSFLIGPIAQFIVIPFMTTGAGVDLIGGWFGTGPDRGIALVFTVTGVIGLTVTLLAMRTKYYRLLSQRYMAK